MKNRDPIPTNREPTQPECVPRRPGIRIIRVEKPLCPHCGHGTWRNGNGAAPNYTTGQMTRYKDCAHCGRTCMFVNEPTPEEINKYWKN